MLKNLISVRNASFGIEGYLAGRRVRANDPCYRLRSNGLAVNRSEAYVAADLEFIYSVIAYNAVVGIFPVRKPLTLRIFRIRAYLDGAESGIAAGAFAARTFRVTV